jgi:hypothetical protein
MKKSIIIFLIPAFIFISCVQKENHKPPEHLNTKVLGELVSKAINNDTTANEKLSNIIDYSLSEDKNYTSLTIDSIVLKNGSIYFYVLLEYPNPFYNRFAIYNLSGDPLFMDKSLNGNLYVEKIETGDLHFLKIDEAFLSKDTLSLNRLSLYLIDTSGVTLSFRTHTKFVRPDNEFTQNITGLNDSLITTQISSLKKSPLDKKEDKFVFIYSQRKYSSSENIFDEFVRNEIQNFHHESHGKEIF